ncbi:tRNA (adenosine(37)-N6)-threonylcarbamoyltransferase complex dimerization subunit type 1 TsaB [Pantoea sp. 1.19]|uniref:tRNA (adenosine(37)-N6)-threonylcarbamoyltransferase complex dimerization subunit type 1 TsaB n=1 Tax=Pantoea sp. 1.19 TaxID=1925589 RepID=UPI000948CAF4|nr:tRNA (adenosine(37)-N6)-threonylcarbamoyltransferase complex dimerization subunit type 1 TsaB [Pantoea sp. 1.19]
MSPRILALDTATEACSVALACDNVMDAQFEPCQREHTQRILPMIDALLMRHGVTLSQLDLLAYGRGPGSFTGVRIGIGIAQGLALGANLPMAGVSTLMTMAESAWRLHGATRVLAAIDARMGEVYWAEYQRDAAGEWQGETTEAVLKPEAALARMAALEGGWATVGTGWAAWPQLAAESALALTATDVTLPTAQDMLPLARQAWQRRAILPVEQAEPTYLRNEVAWKKLPGRE